MWGCNENVSGGADMTNAISVKDRLKKQAIEDGKTMQDKLVTYGLERTIYPGKRKLNSKEPVPAKGMPTCPDWLMPEAKKGWERLAELMNQMGVLTEVDMAAFAAYCQSYAIVPYCFCGNMQEGR